MDAKKGSVGKAAKGCAIRIVDEAKNILPANEPGLIYLGNGRQFEYHDEHEKTLQAMGLDGLATMGDSGYLDQDGYLYLTDRQSHMIISGGVNIYPQEAENVLIEHPEIEDVAVIGVPDAEFGEEVKAIVVPASADHDAAALSGDIIAYCRSRLSAIKCPRSVDFVAELPRSDAGKLLKRLVKAPYWKGHDTTIV
ncbi:MAG: AMP-binding protein [Halieaceae bacterium]|nr:AMP-binding protein [Halieaceae bacterium]